MYDLDEYIGKKVTVNLQKFIPKAGDLEWNEYSDEDEPLNGEGHYYISDRDYNDYDSDDANDDDDEYDETDGWSLETGVDFSIEDGCITYIDKTAQVTSFGDSGLGDVNPDDEWNDYDYSCACLFFTAITR